MSGTNTSANCSVRLAVPRRVYSLSQLAYVAEACGRLLQQRERLRGLEIETAPRVLEDARKAGLI